MNNLGTSNTIKMTYKLIDNLSKEQNHKTRLKELFEVSDSVLIASPFLMPNFSTFLNEIDISNLKKIHLITTLVPRSLDQFHKVQSLISFLEVTEVALNQLDWRISLNNKLHGKIYIFKSKGEHISMIISSANFTDSGLERNHEWGVEISEKLSIREIESSIINSIEIQSISIDEIRGMQKLVKDYKAENPTNDQKKVDLILTNLLVTPDFAVNLDEKVNYWLKPIGVTGSPIGEDEVFENINVGLGILHFAVRPIGIKLNDILIVYGVGSTKILSIYRVNSKPQYVIQQEIDQVSWYKRWPWYLNGENLTPEFGSIWWEQNLRINGLGYSFLKSNPLETLTAVGGRTLGALNHGSDKLKLNYGFAKYIIQRVVDTN